MNKEQTEKVLIINLGGQYDQLIARRIRENGVYCEIMPHDVKADKIAEFSPSAIVLTGGPKSVYEEKAYTVEDEVFSFGVPVLGICYGCQLIAYKFGGKVEGVSLVGAREYGRTKTYFSDAPLFKGVKTSVTWMSHGDEITELPNGFISLARSRKCPFAAIGNPQKKIYGVQFHPEVTHTEYGKQIIKNFLFEVADIKPCWDIKNFVVRAEEEIRNQVKDGNVLLGLSGGVDSSVAAALIGKAIGKKLTCVFVDHGLMRLNEGDEIENFFADKVNFIRIDAKDRFLSALKGVVDPEQKRKIIGEQFIRAFEDIGKKIGSVDYLAQGTIYPDVIESGKGEAEKIKSHHNVGGLPSVIKFKGIIEPLKSLFKDEVRKLGKELGLTDALVNRQPFPGPGLAVRIIGEVTEEKLEILKKADYIFRSEIDKLKKSALPSQYFAVLTNMRTVGVMGDGRTYDYAIALRAVSTEDFMTCDWSKIPLRTLEKISLRIVNEVKGVNRVLYDVTGKPPATVEYE